MFKFSPRKSAKSPRSTNEQVISPAQLKKTRLKEEKEKQQQQPPSEIKTKKSPSRDPISSTPSRTPVRELTTSAKSPSTPGVRDTTTATGGVPRSQTMGREKFNVTFSPKGFNSPPGVLPLSSSPRPISLSGREPKSPGSGTETLWGKKLDDDATFSRGWAFVSECIHWLRTHEAHKCPGLFRKPGNEANVLLLQNTLEKQLSEFRFSDDEDPYSIVTLLKRFFKAMAEPLFTFKLYPTFVSLAHMQTEQEKKNAIRTALSLVPKNNMKLLRFLLLYLHDLAVQHSSTILMDATNLATVFGPTILRPEFETPFILISDLSSVTAVVAALIENFEFFMKNPSIQNPPMKEFEDKLKEFEKEMRKIYTKHSCTTLKALKSVKAACGYDDTHWKQKIISIGDKLKEGDYSMVNHLSNKEIIMSVTTPSPIPFFYSIPSLPVLSSGSLPLIPPEKSPSGSPRTSPRRRTIQDRSVSVNHSLVKVLTKVMGESEEMKTIHEDPEKKQNREHKVSIEKSDLKTSDNTPIKKSQSTFTLDSTKKLEPKSADADVKTPKLESSERSHLFFRNIDKKETEADSEADMEYEKFVVMVSPYNEDELNAQESFSDDQEISSSSSMSYSDPLIRLEHQEIEKVLFHICGEEIAEEEKLELKKMLKIVLLGEEEQ